MFFSFHSSEVSSISLPPPGGPNCIDSLLSKRVESLNEGDSEDELSMLALAARPYSEKRDFPYPGVLWGDSGAAVVLKDDECCCPVA